MVRRTTLKVFLGGAVLVGAGLVAPAVLSATAAESPARRPADPPPVIEVTLNKGTVTMPTTLRSGLNTFSMKGQGRLQLVKVRGAYSPDQLVSDWVAGAEKGEVKPLRSLEKHVVFVGGAEARRGRSTTAQLIVPNGQLWAFDTLAPSASKVLTVQAAGPVVKGSPTGTTTFTAIDPNAWSGESETAAKSGTLVFTNSSSDNHFLAMNRLLPGKTLADFSRWVDAVNADSATAGPPPIDQSAAGFVSPVIGPFRSVSRTYSLPAGDYVVACYWPDAEMGGMKHVFMGMYQGTTLK